MEVIQKDLANRKRQTEGVTRGNDGEWFSGALGRTDDERAFLSRLRGDPAGWSTDVHPADTVAFAWEYGPLVVGIKVPKMTAAYRNLWVSYWSAESGQRALEGAWGSDLIADDYRADREKDLTVAGVKAEPSEFAAWCSRWLINQLARPVVREEWGSGGRAVAWKLSDPDFTLQTKGPWWRRRGAATTVQRER